MVEARPVAAGVMVANAAACSAMEACAMEKPMA
jgi:hypothetical protein